MAKRAPVWSDETFRTMNPHLRFALSMAVIFGTAYAVGKIDGALGMTIAIAGGGAYLFYGGAIKGLPR